MTSISEYLDLSRDTTVIRVFFVDINIGENDNGGDN